MKFKRILPFLSLVSFPSAETQINTIINIGFRSSGGAISKPYDNPGVNWVFPQPGLGIELNRGILRSSLSYEYNWGDKSNLFGAKVKSSGFSIHFDNKFELFNNSKTIFLLGPSTAFNYEKNIWEYEGVFNYCIDSTCTDASGTDEFYNLWIFPSISWIYENIIEFNVNIGYILNLNKLREAKYDNSTFIPDPFTMDDKIKWEFKIIWHFKILKIN